MTTSKYGALGRKAVNLLSCTALVSVELARTMPLAQAQVVADPSAPLANRPSITVNGAGRPQVNITAPNAGVSRNTYTDFNVTADGLILNNSAADTSTSLGAVSANPNLAVSGSASVILNEVASTNPSLLQGKTVVAGPQADVIIANQNGLTCDGCEFEGTGTTTLSTGEAVVSGGDVSLTVEQGNLLIGNGGLTTDGAANLASRHVVIDGPIVSSGDLTVSGGAQFFDPATGVAREAPVTAPAESVYAVDGTAFGAMEAGRIRILGNEAGLGVRSVGALTSAGDVEIQSAGAAEVGAISGATATITARDAVQITGEIVTDGAAQVDAGSLVTAPGAAIRAGGDVAITLAAAMEHYGVIEGGLVTIDAGGRFFNQGFVFGRDDVIVTSADKVENIRGREAFFEDRTVANLQDYAQAISDLAAQHAADDTPWAAYYQQLAQRAQDALFREEVLAEGASIAGVDVAILAAGDFLNSAGVIAAAQDLIIQSTSGSVMNQFQETRFLIDGDTACENGTSCAYGVQYHPAELLAGRDIILEAAADVVVDGSDIAAGRDVEIIANAGGVFFLNPATAITANDREWGEDTVFADYTCETWWDDGPEEECTYHFQTESYRRDASYRTVGVHRPSRIIASDGDIYVEAGGDIIGDGVQIAAGRDVILFADGNVDLHATSEALVTPTERIETYLTYEWREDVRGSASIPSIELSDFPSTPHASNNLDQHFIRGGVYFHVHDGLVVLNPETSDSDDDEPSGWVLVPKTRLAAESGVDTLELHCISFYDNDQTENYCGYRPGTLPEHSNQIDFLNATARISGENIYVEGAAVSVEGARFYSQGDIDLLATAGDLVIDAAQKNYGEEELEGVDVRQEYNLLEGVNLQADLTIDDTQWTQIEQTDSTGKFTYLYWRNSNTGELIAVTDDTPAPVSATDEEVARRQRAHAFLNGSDLLLAVDHLERMAPDGDLPISNLFDAMGTVGLQDSAPYQGDSSQPWSQHGSAVHGFDSLAKALSQQGDLVRLGEEEVSYAPTEDFFVQSAEAFRTYSLEASLAGFEDSLLLAADDLYLSATDRLTLAGGTQGFAADDLDIRADRIDVLSVDDTGVGAVTDFDDATANLDDGVIAGSHWDPINEVWTDLEEIKVPDIDQVAMLAGGDLNIFSTTGFQNYAGRFEAAGALDVTAGGLLVNAALSEDFELTQADGCVGAACGRDGVRFVIGELSGGTSAVVKAGGDLVNRGGVIQSGGALYLRTDGNLINEALSDKFVLVDYAASYSSGGFFSKKKTVIRKFEEAPVIAPGVIEADGGDAVIVSGGHLLVDGSFLAATGDLTVSLPGDATLIARSIETHYIDYYKSSRSIFGGWAALFGGLVFTETVSDLLSTSELDSAAWNEFDNTFATVIGTNVSFTAGGDLYAKGAEFIAEQGLSIRIGGDIIIDPMELATYENIEIASSGVFSDSRYSSSRQKIEIDRSSLAAGSDLNLTSLAGDVNITAGALQAGADLTIEAQQGEIQLLAGIEKELFESETYSANVVWFTNVQEGHYSEEPVHTHLLAGGKLELRAANGLIVEYRGDESLDESIQKLGQIPELAWMLELRTRQDVEWRAIEPVFEQWRDEQEGLTPAGAAIIALAVAVATYGAGSAIAGSVGSSVSSAIAGSGKVVAGSFASAAGKFAGAAVAAGFKSLVTKATISIVNNQGDIGAALNELGSSESLKSLAITIVSAGLTAAATDVIAAEFFTDATGNPIEEALDPSGLLGAAADGGILDRSTLEAIGEELLYQSVSGAIDAGLTLAIEGGDAEDLFLNAALAAAVNTVGAYASAEIGVAVENDLPRAGQLIAHAALGCAIGAATSGDAGSGCAGGAIGGVAGVLTADLYLEFNDEVTEQLALVATNQTTIDEAARALAHWQGFGVELSRLVGGLSAAAIGANVQAGGATSANAFENNALCGGLCIAAAVGAFVYLTSVGEGDPLEGLERLGEGTDPLSEAIASGATAAVTLSSEEYPETTAAVLSTVEQAAGAIDVVVTYTDDVTGNVVSKAWSELDEDTQNRIKGGAAVISVLVPTTSVAKFSAISRASRFCSFHGDTLVLAKRGYVRIRNIVAGEHQVWARNELTGAMGWRPVLAQYSNPYEETVYVAIRDVETGVVQVIRSNRIHPFFAVQDTEYSALFTPVSEISTPPSSEGYTYSGTIPGGAWIDAQYLQPGDQLLNADESWTEVISVTIREEPLQAFNLNVAIDDNFFVAETAGSPVWVHNCNPDYFRKVNFSPTRGDNSITADLNAATKTSSLDGGNWAVAGNRGKWTKSGKSTKSHAHEEAVTGVPARYAYNVNGYEFDGIRDGVLLDAKADRDFLASAKGGAFREKGIQEARTQARNQVQAAPNSEIEWHFSTQETRNLAEEALQAEGLTGRIKLVGP